MTMWQSDYERLVAQRSSQGPKRAETTPFQLSQLENFNPTTQALKQILDLTKKEEGGWGDWANYLLDWLPNFTNLIFLNTGSQCSL